MKKMDLDNQRIEDLIEKLQDTVKTNFAHQLDKYGQDHKDLASVMKEQASF